MKDKKTVRLYDIEAELPDSPLFEVVWVEESGRGSMGLVGFGPMIFIDEDGEGFPYNNGPDHIHIFAAVAAIEGWKYGPDNVGRHTQWDNWYAIYEKAAEDRM